MPVKQTAQPTWFEERDLPERRKCAVRFRAELEPRAPRDFHFRKQPQAPIRLV